MYCKNCGKEITEGSNFCSQCGSPVVAETPQQSDVPAAITTAAAEPEKTPEAVIKADTGMETDSRRKSFMEEFDWHVEDYPGQKSEKTEEIDFDWNANPKDIPDEPKRYTPSRTVLDDQVEISKTPPVQEPLENDTIETAVFGAVAAESEPETLSAADRIDKFYTFNKKNEEFQQLLNREYEKVKSGNAIEHELSKAEELADEKFRSMPEDPSMEAFLEKEGIVKPYQPKAFESDVLQRIEAQEAQKEARRREEEARLAAIEEARKAAEEEAKKKAEEQKRQEEAARITAETEAKIAAETEARIKVEEEARKKAEEEAARLREIAERKAQEEAKAAEEARIKAEKEAKLKAEEEARLRAEEEARLRAEAEAKVKKAEEARIKAEADLKAAQEAAKIRAQQEARLAAEAEARFKANQEKQRLEAEKAKQRLEEQRKKITAEANQAVAEEEVRKVIEQTVRMKDEEAAKIKAAVAAMRDGIDLIKEDAGKREVQEAHQATKNQIAEMTRARDTFFTGLEQEKEAENVKAESQPEDEQQVSDISDLMTDVSEQAPVTGRETMLSDGIDGTKVVDKAAIMAGLSDATIIASKETVPAPASDEEFFNSLDEAAAPEIQDQETAGEAEEAHPIEFRSETDKADEENIDDLLLQFESVNDLAEPEFDTEQQDNEEKKEPELGNTIHVDSELKKALLAENDAQHNESANNDNKNGFEQAAAMNDFDNYGNEEAANYINQQRMQRQRAELKSDMDDFYGDGFYDDVDESQLSKKELKQRAKEQKRLEKERAKEEKILRKRDADFDDVVSDEVDFDDEERSGKGRIVLKIILVILIVILAVEIIGVGIRFIAPESSAAEFIDNQLNKVIHLITGDDTEYSVMAAEDEADFLDVQSDTGAEDGQ